VRGPVPSVRAGVLRDRNSLEYVALVLDNILLSGPGDYLVGTEIGQLFETVCQAWLPVHFDHLFAFVLGEWAESRLRAGREHDCFHAHELSY